MNSGDIHEISNWSDWRAWVARSTLASSGIYVFRLAGGATIPRVKGKSDVLYIGSSLVNLRKRVREHHGMRTPESLLLNLIETHVGQSEVGWANMEKASALAVESDLIFRYFQEHLEFPPANNQQPAQAVREMVSLITLLPPNVRRGVFDHFAEKRLRRK